jgi:hypothetical protein
LLKLVREPESSQARELGQPRATFGRVARPSEKRDDAQGLTVWRVMRERLSQGDEYSQGLDTFEVDTGHGDSAANCA